MQESSEPLVRVMALHALAYCERLFYLEEVEEIKLADASVFAGRTLHEELRQAGEEAGDWVVMELSSETLGIKGKVDCLRRRDGNIIPYEHKRGRSRKDGKTPGAWPSDVIQVSAYAMLLEEETGKKVPEGRVRYHADNATVRIPLDESAKAFVKKSISRAKELRAKMERPPVSSNDRLCIKCSLAPVCLPEEERLMSDSSWEPVRLFPKSRELKTVHVTTHGTRVSRSGDTLKVESTEGEVKNFPIKEVGSVILYGYPQITTQAIHLCAANDISVHWVSAGQRYLTGTPTSSAGVQKKIRQFQALSNPGISLSLARKLSMAKIEIALRYILRATRKMDRTNDKLSESIIVMRNSLKECAKSEGIDSLRGHEGMAGKAYFSAFPLLLRSDLPVDMNFTGRNRRPPKDRINALLGFGYALLYQSIYQSVISVGLEPAFGFFHSPRSSAYPLVLDLMELFRVSVWDIALIGSLNRMQWDPISDFSVTEGRVWLSNEGRKKAIQIFEQRLQETWRHPVTGYSLTYSRLMELEARLLEKEWSGSPGLFARMRLR